MAQTRRQEAHPGKGGRGEEGRVPIGSDWYGGMTRVKKLNTCKPRHERYRDNCLEKKKKKIYWRALTLYAQSRNYIVTCNYQCMHHHYTYTSDIANLHTSLTHLHMKIYSCKHTFTIYGYLVCPSTNIYIYIYLYGSDAICEGQ